MAKVLDEPSRKAVAATVRYYRDLGIYDLYRREIPEGLSFGRTIVREEFARIEEASAAEPPAAESGNAALPVADAQAAAALAAIQQDKPSALRVIREDIGDCTRCELCRERTNIVFGVGDPHARIMFVGEGPGADEDAQGEPFVGRAGQLLNNMIQAMGIRREDVYIGNVVKCRPPKNRAPEPVECATCGPIPHAPDSRRASGDYRRPRRHGGQVPARCHGLDGQPARTHLRFPTRPPRRAAATGAGARSQLRHQAGRHLPSRLSAARSAPEKRNLDRPADW